MRLCSEDLCHALQIRLRIAEADYLEGWHTDDNARGRSACCAYPLGHNARPLFLLPPDILPFTSSVVDQAVFARRNR